jgi:hypothetical protein
MSCHFDGQRRILIVCLAVCIALAALPVVASSAQADPAADMLARINGARVANGLPPYFLSDKLTAAAQAHSKDMASRGKVDRTGSDGSAPRTRALAAGYGQWSNGPIVDEAIYGGTGSAFDWWMGTDSDKGRILSPRYREVGIGAATAPNGWVYWAVEVGAQPNVLPFFMNGGVTRADLPEVVLTLTTENAVPAGEGTATIGQPLQIKAAPDDSFTGVEWQPWAAQVTYKLQPLAQQTIHMLYRDAQGRTAPFSTTVTLSNVPTLTATPLPSRTSSPTLTPPPTNTRKPTETTVATRAPTSTSAGNGLATATPPPLTPLALAATVNTPPASTPRGTPRPRFTPTAVPTGPYGSPPGEMVAAVVILQAVAIVLAALAILGRTLRRMPAAPEAAQSQTQSSDPDT